MNLTDTEKESLQRRIAANLAHYRRLAGYTQSELAERINYSDKSVSKWERGGGSPDIYVLAALAKLYGVTVNDFFSENAPLPAPDLPSYKKSRFVSCLQYIALVWLAATAAFTFMKLYYPDVNGAWRAFVVAVPCSAVVFVVLAQLWWGRLMKFVSISSLAWSGAACVFMYMLDFAFAYLLFIVCAVTQATVLLWFMRSYFAEKEQQKQIR